MASFTDAQITDILTASPSVAVLGIHTQPDKAAFYVPEYLFDEGYKIYGVNPRLVGEKLFEQPVRATLAELHTPIDLVDVFRRPDAIPLHVPEILAMSPRPKVVWFQLGIKNEDAAKLLEAAGIVVVQNKCTLAEHQRLKLGPPQGR
jgi:predicted CoA-binding protein